MVESSGEKVDVRDDLVEIGLKVEGGVMIKDQKPGEIDPGFFDVLNADP